jgi:hypothetical protein
MTHYFLEELEIAIDEVKKDLNKEAVKIMDVGCGTGRILDLAQTYIMVKEKGNMRKLYPATYGIEHDERIKLFPSRNHLIDIGDAMDYKKYSEMDIIHYYCPIKDEDMMQLLEEKIEKEAKSGAIIIARFKKSQAYKENENIRIIRTNGNSEYRATIIQKL